MNTKQEIEQLDQRPPKTPVMHLTIGGTIEQEVHTKLETERRAKLTQGRRLLDEASQSVHKNFVNKSREGYSRARFNAASMSHQNRIKPANTNHHAGQVRADRTPQRENRRVQEFKASMRRHSADRQYEQAR